MAEDANLSLCARKNLRKLKALTTEALSTSHELPCGCQEVKLKDLLNDYDCEKCGETYFYCVLSVGVRDFSFEIFLQFE